MGGMKSSCIPRILFLPLAVLLLATRPVISAPPTLETLQREIEALKKSHAEERAAQQKEIAALKKTLNEMRADRGERPANANRGVLEGLEGDYRDFSMNYRSDGVVRAGGLKFGAYGETRFTMARGQNSVFDPTRLVLLPSYQINPYLVFNAEIEVEHGGLDDSDGFKTSSNTSSSRFDGEVEIEQMFVDWMINEHFNIRSPGIDVVPVGRINLYHEPTLFYSVDRPELYANVIPSTWFEPGFSFFGRIVEGLDYRVMISQGLDDANTSGGVSAAGIRGARPGMRRVTNNSLAYSARLAWTPTQVRGLQASTSAYYTDVARNHGPGALGQNDRSVGLTVWDIEALYRIPHTPVELRADYARIFIDNPRGLQANLPNAAGAAPNPANAVGDEMYGWYLEVALHLWPESWKKGSAREVDVVPFARYTQTNTQTGDFEGPAAPTGRNFHDIYTFGVAFFPAKEFVIKLDYQIDDTRAANVADANTFRVGAGFFF